MATPRQNSAIPTEPIGSIPRPLALIEAIQAHHEGAVSDAALEVFYDEAVRDTIAQFEATGSPVISDGEQRKNHNFATYCVDGAHNFAPDGFKPHQRAFVGVIDVLDPRIESPEEVRDRVLEAAEIIPLNQLGTTDDCGYSPFCDDISTSRETAFEKIRSRVQGTMLAAEKLGLIQR